MCGIAGILNRSSDEPVAEMTLRRMLALIRHRGPDQFGIFLDDGVGLGSARLSIIDVGHGQQPITNEDGTLWIVFNGEIFNYVELRPELEARGHRFRTQTDTEVLLHLFEEFGPDCLARLNGQFAFAIWDANERQLFLARDRFGIRPLFYARPKNGSLVFGSEIKSILGSGRIEAALDPAGIDQVFNYWSTIPPRTVFRDIVELPPGHWLRATADEIEIQSYWNLPAAEAPASNPALTESEIQSRAEELRELLTDAVRLRLRADVPVAAYLSGGLDSSVIAALARDVAPDRLNTFSISFSDPEFDESEFQQRMAVHLGTRHEVIYTTHEDIGRAFPDVVWHCETPVLRTSPAPMFLLSGLLQQRGFKVALTGEGADEMLGGYDVFKEAKIRRFWAAQPLSKLRPRLLQRLYPDIAALKQTGADFLAAFFGDDLMSTDSPFYSHAIRWRNGARHRRFFTGDLLEATAGVPSCAPPLGLPEDFMRRDPLARAQHLEISIFLANYLLSSQGDRMSMAHAVEGRFPFLDFRVAEFCARLPANLKLRALTEKYLLRRVAAPLLPPEIAGRRKRPYRAPIHRAFFHARTPDYVDELLSLKVLNDTGFFKPAAVSQLAAKIQSGARISETDDMALAGILSTQLVHRQFIADFRMPAPLSDRADVKVCLGPKIETRNSKLEASFARALS